MSEETIPYRAVQPALEVKDADGNGLLSMGASEPLSSSPSEQEFAQVRQAHRLYWRSCQRLERDANDMRGIGINLCDLARENGDPNIAKLAASAFALADRIREHATLAWRVEAKGNPDAADERT